MDKCAINEKRSVLFGPQQMYLLSTLWTIQDFYLYSITSYPPHMFSRFSLAILEEKVAYLGSKHTPVSLDIFQFTRVSF